MAKAVNIWALTGQQKRLGRAARRIIERADRGEAVLYVPTISLVEVGEAERRGGIRFIRLAARQAIDWALARSAAGCA
jgi:predicted nucleic acid-binding protein